MDLKSNDLIYKYDKPATNYKYNDKDTDTHKHTHTHVDKKTQMRIKIWTKMYKCLCVYVSACMCVSKYVSVFSVCETTHNGTPA